MGTGDQIGKIGRMLAQAGKQFTQGVEERIFAIERKMQLIRGAQAKISAELLKNPVSTNAIGKILEELIETFGSEIPKLEEDRRGAKAMLPESFGRKEVVGELLATIEHGIKKIEIERDHKGQKIDPETQEILEKAKKVYQNGLRIIRNEPKPTTPPPVATPPPEELKVIETKPTEKMIGVSTEPESVLVKPENIEELAALPRKEAIGKIADGLENEGRKMQAKAKLRETIEDMQRIIEKENREMEIRRKEREELKRELKEIRRTSDLTEIETAETPKVETFSIDFIKETAKNILSSKKEVSGIEDGETKEEKVKIKEVKNFEIEGKGNEIKLFIKTNVDVKIPIKDDPINTNVETKIILGNKSGVVEVKNYKINALGVPILFRGVVNTALEFSAKKEFRKVPEKLKDFIEKERSRKVKEMEIVNGELKVTYS